MNKVIFPSINLEFEFSKIAFSLFGIQVYKYSICIVLGIIVALILCKLSKEKFDNKFQDILDIIGVSLLCGIIGARIYYVIFNMKYYSKFPLEALNIRDGGLAIYGGLITGLIISIYLCKRKKVDVLNFLDYVVPFIVLAQAIGRWGNFFNIEAYGYQTNSIFRMGIIEAGKYAEVHPIFLYESFLDFLIFIFLRLTQKKRKFKGQIVYMYGIMYSFVRIILEGYRADSLMLYKVRISQILSYIIFIISTLIYNYNVFRLRKNMAKKSKEEK